MGDLSAIEDVSGIAHIPLSKTSPIPPGKSQSSMFPAWFSRSRTPQALPLGKNESSSISDSLSLESSKIVSKTFSASSLDGNRSSTHHNSSLLNALSPDQTENSSISDTYDNLSPKRKEISQSGTSSALLSGSEIPSALSERSSTFERLSPKKEKEEGSNVDLNESTNSTRKLSPERSSSPCSP